MYNQYFSKHRVISMILPSGRKIMFTGGVYITSNKEDIEFLDAEVAAGNPFVFTRKGEEKITEEQRDPLLAIKKKAVEEYLAKQAAQQDPSRDMGNSEVPKAAGMVDTAKLVVGAASISSKK